MTDSIPRGVALWRSPPHSYYDSADTVAVGLLLTEGRFLTLTEYAAVEARVKAMEARLDYMKYIGRYLGWGIINPDEHFDNGAKAILGVRLVDENFDGPYGRREFIVPFDPQPENLGGVTKEANDAAENAAIDLAIAERNRIDAALAPQGGERVK